MVKNSKSQRKTKTDIKRTLIEAGILLVLVLGVLVYFLGLHRADLSVPMNYGKANTGDMLTRTKLICMSGWNETVTELGAPFGATLTKQPGFLMQLLDAGFLRLLYILTGNVAVALNLQIIVCFFAMAFTSFYAMKKLRFGSFGSILGSLTFATSTYIFMMALTEYGMMNCYFVPLALLVALWLFEDGKFFKLDRSFFHYRKNIAAIVITVLMCFNGGGYYSFFAGLIILTAGFSATLKGKGKEKLFAGLILSGMMLVLGLLLNIPSLLGQESFYAGGSAVAAAEINGLKLIQMFLPLNNLGIDFLGRVINSYYKYTIVRNSLNSSSFLGIVGIIGFVILVLALLLYFVKKHKNERFVVLAEMNLVLLLVCQTGGIGALLTGIFNGGLTDYAKGVIFIIYISILAFFMGLEWLLGKVRHKLPVAALGCAVIAGSILIQLPAQFGGFYGDLRQQYDTEAAFVKEMEARLEDGAKVYEPTVTGRYNPVAASKWEYNNRSVGFYLSDCLCWNTDVEWSYDAQGWRGHLQGMSYEEMVHELVEAGFTAIFIDRSNYDSQWYLMNELEELEDELVRITGNQFCVSANGKLEFIRLQ